MCRTIRAIAFEENGWWVAQCLEYDIAAQAKTFEKLIHELYRLLLGYSVIGKKENIDVWGGKSKAPVVFWKLFHRHGKKVMLASDPYNSVNEPRPRLVEVRIVKRKATTLTACLGVRRSHE